MTALLFRAVIPMGVFALRVTWGGGVVRALVAAVLTFVGVVPAFSQLLTRAADIRALSPAEAERGRDVKLRGVVVLVEGPSAVFVQDETSTTFFRTDQLPLPAVGDEIEVLGRTRMGLYLPGLDRSRFTVLGQRPLPPGIPATLDDLFFSRFHYQRVAVEGIVRSIVPMEKNRSLLRLAMGSRVLEIWIESPPDEGRSLTDSRVRITGLAAGSINKARRQLVQPYVRALDWNEVEVLTPAPALEAVPVISAEELLAFQASGRGERRVRIRGVVTAVFPHEQVFLQQGELAFAVRLNRAATLALGDRIEVAGFPEMDRFSGWVVDAELVTRESGAAPVPKIIEGIEKLTEAHDATLVAVSGFVRDVSKTEEGVTLLLSANKRTLQARLPEGTEPPEVGARVQVTGIYEVQTAEGKAGFTSTPVIVSLLARGSDDIVLLQPPAWWTARRLAGVLAALGGVSVLAGLWIAVLRRQVSRQTTALRHRFETQAVLEERQRIAREFHDTLEQELAGVSLRLDALATRDADDKARNLISASRNLVSRIQAETRDLIGDLRDANEQAGDLLAALEGVAARHAAESGADVRVTATAMRPALPPATVHDLRMIAREAVTNALNHGRATSVTIVVEADDGLTLRVVDNGCGFDPAVATQQRRGHFGCEGIRERVRKIGGEVTWRSELQRGTTVQVTLSGRTRSGASEPARVPGLRASETRHVAS